MAIQNVVMVNLKSLCYCYVQLQDEEYKDTLPGKGAQTSTFYVAENVPRRFDNPGT